MRLFVPGTSSKELDWAAYKASLPSVDLVPVLYDSIYYGYLRDEIYNNDISALNRAWSTNYTNFSQIQLQAREPTQPAEANDWSTFVRTRLPLRFVVFEAPTRKPLQSSPRTQSGVTKTVRVRRFRLTRQIGCIRSIMHLPYGGAFLAETTCLRWTICFYTAAAFGTRSFIAVPQY